MASYKTTLKNKNQDTLYPQTKADIVYTSNGSDVQTVLDSYGTRLANAEAVTGKYKGYYPSSSQLPRPVPPETGQGWYGYVDVSGEPVKMWIYDVSEHQWVMTDTNVEGVEVINGKSGQNVTLDATDIDATVGGVTDSIQDHLSALNSDISSLGDEVDTKADETDLQALEGRVDTAEDDIDNIEGRLDTAEDNISDLSGDLQTLENSLATVATTGRNNDLIDATIINSDLSSIQNPVTNQIYRHTGNTDSNFIQYQLYYYDTSWHKLGEGAVLSVNGETGNVTVYDTTENDIAKFFEDNTYFVYSGSPMYLQDIAGKYLTDPDVQQYLYALQNKFPSFNNNQISLVPYTSTRWAVLQSTNMSAYTLWYMLPDQGAIYHLAPNQSYQFVEGFDGLMDNVSAYKNDAGYLTASTGVTSVNGSVGAITNIATLNDIPTVPTDLSDFNNDVGYITGIDSSDVTTALGYTPADSADLGTASAKDYTSSVDSSNDLPTANAVRQFVNSSIATNTANFLGTFNIVTDLGLTTSATEQQIASALTTALTGTTVTNNDYVFVSYPDEVVPTEYVKFDRWKASVENNVTTWNYEYTLNNSTFTAQQWASINSGITSTLVSQIGTNATDIASLQAIKYGATLYANGTTLQLKDQDGNVLSTVTTQDTDDYRDLSNAPIIYMSGTQADPIVLYDLDEGSYLVEGYLTPIANGNVYKIWGKHTIEITNKNQTTGVMTMCSIGTFVNTSVPDINTSRTGDGLWIANMAIDPSRVATDFYLVNNSEISEATFAYDDSGILDRRVLTVNNTKEYSPTYLYNPTTKKYVDDKFVTEVSMTSASNTGSRTLQRTKAGSTDSLATFGSSAFKTAGNSAGNVPLLDNNGKLDTSVIPDVVMGQMEYKGTFDASTGSTLTGLEKGWYYVCSTAGSKNPDGTTASYTYAIGDWAVYNGTSWDKIDNTDAVSSVNGQTGAVQLTASDVGALPSTTSFVSDVTYDSTNKKIQKTIGNTTSDVVTFGSNAFNSDSYYLASNPNGYTSNTGTITGVQLNGDSVATSGVANVRAMPNFNLSLSTSSGGTQAIKFITVDYNSTTSEAGVLIKLSMVSGHGNGSSYKFLQDVILSVNYQGTVSANLYKYYGADATYDSTAHQFGDIFWTIDTTNKVVVFYTIAGQYSSVKMTPYMRLNSSSGGTITQHTGTAVKYSSGTKNWGTGGNLALVTDIPTVNNPTITITQGGVTKGSFSLNQASGDTIALDAGGSAPTNMVTTDTTQTISGQKTFSSSTTKVNSKLEFTDTSNPHIQMTSGSNTYYFQAYDGKFGLGPSWALATQWNSSGVADFKARPTVNGSNIALSSEVPDVSALVSNVSYNSSSRKLQQTKNGSTTDVVTFGSNAFSSTTIPSSKVGAVTSVGLNSWSNGGRSIGTSQTQILSGTPSADVMVTICVNAYSTSSVGMDIWANVGGTTILGNTAPSSATTNSSSAIAQIQMSTNARHNTKTITFFVPSGSTYYVYGRASSATNISYYYYLGALSKTQVYYA